MNAAEVSITEQRTMTVDRVGASVHWRVTEFDSERVMLIAEAGSTHFSAHFTAEEWAELQKLIAANAFAEERATGFNQAVHAAYVTIDDFTGCTSEQAEQLKKLLTDMFASARAANAAGAA